MSRDDQQSDSLSSITETLRVALNEEKLAEAVAAFDPETLEKESATLVRRVQATLNRIADDCRARAAELVQLMSQVGIDAHIDETELATRPPQFHRFRLHLATYDPTPGIRAALDHGYRTDIDPAGAGWHAFRRCQNELVLTRKDAETTRVVLSWQTRWPDSWLTRRLKITLFDAGRLRLAGVWWPGVFAMKPFWIVRNRISPVRAKRLAVWLGTPPSLLPDLFAAAKVTPDDHLLDIGCGDGRVLISAALELGCRGTGWDTDAELIEIADQTARDQRISDLLTFAQVDVRAADLPEVDVVFLFLPVDVLGEIVTRLDAQMPPGTRILAHEQSALRDVPAPDSSELLVGERSFTVVHLWTVGSG